MFLYLARPASISFFFLAICGVGHPLTIIIWFNKVVVVVVGVYDVIIHSPYVLRISAYFKNLIISGTKRDI